MDSTIAFQQTGPHNGGFFYSGGFNDGVVTFIPGQH